MLDFWSNIAFLAQSIIFLVLGAGFSISMLTSVWFQALVIVLLLFFVIRPISVFVATHFKKRLSRGEKLFLSWIGARGAVPAALAASAIRLGIAEASQIFNIVVVVVLASLLITGFTGRKMAKATLTTPLVSKKSQGRTVSCNSRKLGLPSSVLALVLNSPQLIAHYLLTDSRQHVLST